MSQAAMPAPERAAYVTTERAGSRVAGRPVEPGRAGQDLLLTAEEAAHELGEGTLVRKGETLSPAFSTFSEGIAALHAGIAAARAGETHVEPAPAPVEAPSAAEIPPAPSEGKPTRAAKAPSTLVEGA